MCETSTSVAVGLPARSTAFIAATYGEPSPKSVVRVTSGNGLLPEPNDLRDRERPAFAEGLAVHLAADVDGVGPARLERTLGQQRPLIGAHVAAGSQRVAVDRFP